MRHPPKKKLSYRNKCFYIFMAFVTMVAVHFFARPIKRGFGSLGRRLKKNSKKNTLREQLELGQKTSPVVFGANSEATFPKRTKKSR